MEVMSDQVLWLQHPLMDYCVDQLMQMPLVNGLCGLKIPALLPVN
jgi:hypothetical protein